MVNVPFYEKNRTVINKILFVSLLILFCYAFLNYFIVYVSPFVVGFIISCILNPLVGFLERKFSIHRGVCALFVILIFILLLSFLGIYGFSRLIREAKSFATNSQAFVENINIMVHTYKLKFNNFLTLPEDIQQTIDIAIKDMLASMTLFFSMFVRDGSLNIVTKIPNFLMNVILGLISAFFFIKDKELIQNAIKKITPKRFYKHFASIKTGLLSALGGYVRAQLTIMSVIGTICVLGLTILKNPYALLIGLLCSAFDALPIFGLGAIFWPWIAFSLIGGNYSQAIGLGIVYGVAFMSRQMLEPKVLGEQIGVHPLLTLMAVYVGLKLFGPIGLFLGPTIAITIKIVFEKPEKLKEDMII